MLQNSLDRLFVGMATTLHERVLPAVDDRAVAAQVRAMVELLGNLSTRVTWDAGQLVELRDRIAEVLDRAVDLDGAAEGVGIPRERPRADPLDAGALQAEVVARLAALGDLQSWLATTDDHPELARAVDDLVDWHLGRELDLLRSASFGRP